MTRAGAMLRHWRGIGCLLATLPCATPLHACRLPTDAVTVQAGRVALDGQSFTAATQTLADLNQDRSRLLVLDGQCRVAWSATVDGILSHFDVRSLGTTGVLQFVTMRVAGDGTGYTHRLLWRHAGRLVALLPPIEHTGKDGFYLGRLATRPGRPPSEHGPGYGIVTWTADPRAGSEADPHPFIVRRWTWSGARLAGPTQYETTQTFAAPDNAPSRPDFVARAIGLGLHDQTGDISSRFRDYDGLDARRQDLAARLGNGH